MSRLFTFGCSFTQYKWPTWADIIAKEFNDFENHGRSGAGNQFIHHSLIECHLKNKIKTDDTVVIMWSSTGRESRYVKGQWLTPGNIYNSNLFDNNYIDSWVDVRGFIMRDLDLMYTAMLLLESIGCKYVFLSMVPLGVCHDYFDQNQDHTVADILPYYQLVLQKIRPSIFEVVFDNNWDSREFICKNTLNFWQQWYANIKDQSWPMLRSKSDYQHLPQKIKTELTDVFNFFIPNLNTPHGRADYHPTPMEHLEYLDIVAQEFTITEQTRRWVKECDQKVRSNIWTDMTCQDRKIW